jgi:hypothetical protein
MFLAPISTPLCFKELRTLSSIPSIFPACSESLIQSMSVSAFSNNSFSSFVRLSPCCSNSKDKISLLLLRSGFSSLSFHIKSFLSASCSTAVLFFSSLRLSDKMNVLS